jgi:hypothetical protein
MKKLYYFSKQKLQFIEIKDYKKKAALILTAVLILSGSAVIGGYHLISSLLNPAVKISSIKEENRLLKEKLDEVVSKFATMNEELDSLSKLNDVLRVAANLPPLSEDERMVGVGGGYFDNTLDFFRNPNELKLNEALSFVDEVSRKIEFEKTQYLQISKKIRDNEKLFASLPAIKPCDGTLAMYGFGMRNHPILRINRIHEGIDIITDVGTKVVASGDGRVEFVGHRGGYGLAVEIDHGFGYRTLYAHLSSVTVKEGKRIKRGEMIARTGNSGLSTGPHLHYEISHNGVKLNPSEFFFDDMQFFDKQH